MPRLSSSSSWHSIAAPAEDLIVLDEILEGLSGLDPAAGQLLKLRYFAGLSVEGGAEVLGMSPAPAPTGPGRSFGPGSGPRLA